MAKLAGLVVPETLKRFFWSVAALVLVIGVWQLEAERMGIHQRTIDTDAGSVTLYSSSHEASGPLVFVAHGFAGSRQMMQYISRDLARGGFTVAAFDFYGQGRSHEPMSSDVTRIEGTTMQLVGQTLEVVRAVQKITGYSGDIALLGHSMATDIVIRAAKDLPEVAAIVAVSMYSDAVTPDFPKRLLILSGEWEGRLRDVAQDAVAQVGGQRVEGQTVQSGQVIRRAVSVSHTEHVAVLFARQTMEETRDWLQQAFGVSAQDDVKPRGLAVLAVLTSVVVLFWPLCRVLPKQSTHMQPLSTAQFLAAVVLPVLPAILLSNIVADSILGIAAFGGLGVFFAVWGGAALAVVLWNGQRLQRPRVGGMALLLFWALVVFALALDRYAAAFLPAGPRLAIMGWLMVGTLPFMLADRLLVAGAALWKRSVARMAPIAALAAGMLLFPQNLGLLFTVLPVLLLFFGVFGTMARAVALRSGPVTAAVAQSVILAWSIAASTPLFEG